MRRRKRQYLIRVVHRGPDAARVTRSPHEGVRLTGATPSRSRHELIAEAAYYRALRREFRGGSAVEDWLVAEAWVDAWLLAVPEARSRGPQSDRRTADRSHR